MDKDEVWAFQGDWLPIGEATEALDLSITEVMELVRSNRLQAEQQGRHLMISVQSLLDFWGD